MRKVGRYDGARVPRRSSRIKVVSLVYQGVLEALTDRLCRSFNRAWTKWPVVPRARSNLWRVPCRWNKRSARTWLRSRWWNIETAMIDYPALELCARNMGPEVES
jgi:hypothetical protein